LVDAVKGISGVAVKSASASSSTSPSPGSGNNNNDDNRKKVELSYELIKKTYDDEFQMLKDYDSKASSIVGFVTIMTGLLVGLAPFSLLDEPSEPDYYMYAPYFTAIGFFLATIIFSLWTIKLRRYEHAPTSQFVKKRLQTKDKKYESMTKEILFELEKSTSENRAENYEKSKKKKKLVVSYFGSNFSYRVCCSLRRLTYSSTRRANAN
jgi:hypothetical protein